MTNKQNEIYKGLKSIGPEIAQFYSDGIEIISSDLGTKSYLLGHLLREIDGGLRNIFEPKSKKIQFQKEITDEQLEVIFNEFKEDYKNYDYLKDITFEDFKKEKGHISSIMVSFGFSFDNPLSKQYIKVARWLNKYAHRSGAFNTPRNPKDIINIWNEFEEVLLKLIGNYYALAERIDSILKMEEPTDEILLTLPNLLNTESKLLYFFNGLKFPKWFEHLYKQGYFKGPLNPEPVESADKPGFYFVPYWCVLQFLEEIANQNLKATNENISKTLVLIINEISSYRKEDGKRIENFRTNYTLFKLICTLPEKDISKNHFLFIQESLKNKWSSSISFDFGKLLERLITIGNRQLLISAVEILLTHKYDEKELFEKVYSLFDDYLLNRILSEHKKSLINALGPELLDLSIKKAEALIIIDKTIFNNISIPAIEDNEQTSFPDHFDCQIVYLIRDCLELLPSDSIREALTQLLKHENTIFKRIAVYIINVRFKEFNTLFWDWDVNPLDFTLVKHEIYELLKNHSKDFTESEIKHILQWINQKEYYIPEEFKGKEEVIRKSIAYRKKEWLSAMEGLKNKEIQKLIEELNTINDAKVEHPGYHTWHSSLMGAESPLTADNILQMNIEEIVNYFDEFGKKTPVFFGPSIDGLSDTLVYAIRKNPNNYNKECGLILGSSSHFKYCWIRGLQESWREEKLNFDCDEVFITVDEILSDTKFWDSFNSSDNYCMWLITSLLSFIEDGLRDDSHAFDPNLLPLIKRILFIILKEDKQEVLDYSDLTMVALNNSKGKIFMTLMQYSLRLARLEAKESNRWDMDIKTLIDNIIKSDKENPLAFYVLGQFLSNIYYLDKDWLLSNFNQIFPIGNKVNWSAAMNGYLFHHRQANKLYFNLFVENSHYKKALESDFDNIWQDTKKNLIVQICNAYLYGFDKMDIDSDLMRTLMNTKIESNYSAIIFLFWSPQFPIDKTVSNRIKPLWERIFKGAIELKNPEIDKKILSGCCKWINSIPEIDDDIMEWLKDSIPYIMDVDRYAIIESLSKHITNTPEKVGTILLEIFKTGVTFDLSRDKVLAMVEILYQKGYKEIANKICLLHAEQGVHFLKEEFNRYNA